jgi:2-dehydro-3-deoxyphosphogluconate aldolase/(4S)-4-hydroxy-2-oxoglutarate aldolase
MTERAGETSATLARMEESRVVAIVRLGSTDALVDVAQALAEGGITVLEFTLTTPGAVEAIERSRAALGDRVVVGAGTVLTAEDARRCLDAGARFIVSPIFDAGVVETTLAGGAVAMPGANTPTEAMTASRAGAQVIKIFPARHLGPKFISDLLAPLPHLKMIPTGGVNASNAGDYLRAGAIAVGVGESLVNGRIVSERRWEDLTAAARRMVEAVREGATTD